MTVDILGKEISVGDEVIMGTGSGCFKAKITRETAGRFYYTAWDKNSSTYNTYSWYGNKTSYMLRNMYKI